MTEISSKALGEPSPDRSNGKSPFFTLRIASAGGVSKEYKLYPSLGRVSRRL